MINASEANKIMQSVSPDNFLDGVLKELDGKVKAKAEAGDYYLFQTVTGTLNIVDGNFSFTPNENSRALAGRLMDLGYNISFCLDGEVSYRSSQMPIKNAAGCLMISWFDC